jgi:hypothetical protein
MKKVSTQFIYFGISTEIVHEGNLEAFHQQWQVKAYFTV